MHERLASTAVDIEEAGADTASGAGTLDCLAATAVSDMALTNQVRAAEVTPGEGVVYTMTVSDNGPDPGTRLALAATLADGVTFASSASGCVADGRHVSCPLADQASGEHRTLTFEATVDGSLESGTVLATAATVESPFDVALANNTATATATVVIPPPVASLAATGSSRFPTLPLGLALVGAAMLGLALTSRSRVAHRG